MPKSVHLADVLTAYKALAEQAIAKAAGANTVVSKQEQGNLSSPWLEAAQNVRSSGAPRVTVTNAVARAAEDAERAWAMVNQKSGPGSTILSEKELGKLTQQSPFIGAMTLLAVRSARALTEPPAADFPKAARAFIEAQLAKAKNGDYEQRFHWVGLPAGTRLDVRTNAALRASVPADVLTAFDAYYRMEDADWGSVSLHKGMVAGHVAYLVYASTDGDDEYVELFHEQGKSVASARVNASELVAWDEFGGRARLSHKLLEPFSNSQASEGLSDDAERLAAGQILSTWQPDVVVDQGSLGASSAAPGLLGTITLAAALSNPQRDLAYAAFDILFDRSLRHRLDPSAGALLLPDQGRLRLGTFAHPTGETLLVADWKDIDDDSRTLYFRQGAHGLELAIDQYNN